MKLHNPGADFFVPDNLSPQEALARVTHLGIGAHQDDLEFMAFSAIKTCFRHEGGAWFGGVVCTDGTGSARKGPYAGYGPGPMREVRRSEQRAAAVVGHYAAMVQLDYPSSALRGNAGYVSDIRALLEDARPREVLTHNLADKHPTHIAVVLGVIEAARSLPPSERPERLLGCEVWRGLDWMPDREKIALDTGGAPHLASALNGIFDSQIGGGKRYDLATVGRQHANATYYQSHATDSADSISFAMDLTPLLLDDSLEPLDFVLGVIDRFREEVSSLVSGE